MRQPFDIIQIPKKNCKSCAHYGFISWLIFFLAKALQWRVKPSSHTLYILSFTTQSTNEYKVFISLTSSTDSYPCIVFHALLNAEYMLCVHSSIPLTAVRVLNYFILLRMPICLCMFLHGVWVFMHMYVRLSSRLRGSRLPCT